MTLILIVGGLVTLFLLVNAALSFATHEREILSWLRLQFALLAALATAIVANAAVMLGVPR